MNQPAEARHAQRPVPAGLTFQARAPRLSRASLGLVLAELDSFARDVFTFLATGLKATPRGGNVAAASERILARVAARSTA